MTETAPVTCIREGAPRTGSVGPALDIVDARVADPTGNVVADGQVGELQVQSPANCVGYWDDPRATAATFDDGWLRTGDLVSAMLTVSFGSRGASSRSSSAAAPTSRRRKWRRLCITILPFSRLASLACPTRSTVKK